MTDSGRYGVVAGNPAGRAECLADVMVTELIMQQAPPQVKSSSSTTKVRCHPQETVILYSTIQQRRKVTKRTTYYDYLLYTLKV